MCGILAILDAPSSTERALHALDSMAHRGPDDQAVWCSDAVWMGARRLAIVDPDPRSRQPLRHDATGVVVIFNGEIFNHRELRRQLQRVGHRFWTLCDTEVLLHAYLQWGADAVEHLNGMWAFVIWDPRIDSIVYSRDRFGIKPLYTAPVGGGRAFASEPKALLALDPGLDEPDHVAIRELLASRRSHHTGRSFYRRVTPVPPGIIARHARGAHAAHGHSYWQPTTETTPISAQGALDRFSEVFEDAVRIRTDHEHVAFALSGGLDSAAICAAAAEGTASDISAYTTTYAEPGIDERRWAHVAAAHASGVSVKQVEARANEWLATLVKIVRHMDGPGATPAVFGWWTLCSQIRADGRRVVLDGQGADEMLGGYAPHVAARIEDLTAGIAAAPSRSGLTCLYRTLRPAAQAFGHRRLAQDIALDLAPLARRLYSRQVTLHDALSTESDARSEPPDRGRSTKSPPLESRLDQRLRRDFSADMLPAYLQFGDAISMAHGVESRQPFLDHRLVELCSRLPADLKVGQRGTKTMLRIYLDSKAQRHVASRLKKQGYPTPANAWMAANGGHILREVLLDRSARTSDLVDRRQLRRLIQRHASGRHAAGDALYALLATELWMQGGS